MINSELIPRSTIEELVNLYTDKEQEMVRAFGVIQKAAHDLAQAFDTRNGGNLYFCDGHNGTYVSFDQPERYMCEIRRQVWRILIKRTGVWAILSVRASEEFHRKIEREEPPAITVENVVGMIAGIQSQVESMLRDSIHEVFEFLRPHRSTHKTNTEFEIGERVILTSTVECWGNHWSIRHWSRARFVALENVLLLLDGKRREAVTGYGDLETAIRAAAPGPQCVGETAYLSFRGYRKNGNIHLRFKRMDLIQRLNAIAGGARLKPTEGRLDL